MPCLRWSLLSGFLLLAAVDDAWAWDIGASDGPFGRYHLRFIGNDDAASSQNMLSAPITPTWAGLGEKSGNAGATSSYRLRTGFAYSPFRSMSIRFNADLQNNRDPLYYSAPASAPMNLDLKPWAFKLGLSYRWGGTDDR